MELLPPLDLCLLDFECFLESNEHWSYSDKSAEHEIWQLEYCESEIQIDCDSLQRVFSSWGTMEGGEVVEARRSHSEMGA